MQGRTLAAILISLGIFFGWQKFYIEPRVQAERAQLEAQKKNNPAPQAAATTTQAPNAPQAGATQTSGMTAAAPEAPRKPLETKSLTLSDGVAKVGNSAAVLADWNLSKYKFPGKDTALGVDLAYVTKQTTGDLELFLDEGTGLNYLSKVQGTLSDLPDGGVLWTYEDANLKYTREVRAAAEGTHLNILFNVEIKNPAIKPKAAFLSLVATGSSDSAESMDRKLVYYDGHKYQTEDLSSELEFKAIPGEMRWMGAVTRYFALAVVEEGSKSGAPRPTALVQNAGLVGGTHAGRISLVYAASGPRISIPVKVYLGPKELTVIKKVDKSLDLMVDFGFFSAFAYPLLLILKWIQGVVVNWGVAIILLTILVKIVTFPLNYKSMKSMRELSKLTPQIQKLKEKYKDDKQKQNQEMMLLMRNNKANPLAGCLPILVQMPVFFALYSLLYSAFELYGAPFGFWIQDLSVKDPFYVTPVLLTGLMYLQQKLTPNTVTDPMQAKMMQLMPVIFGVFMISLPSGLAIYMLTNSAVSIVQQIFLNKHLDKIYGPIVVPKPVATAKA